MNNLKNSVRLMGRLGAAPEVRELANNKKMARLSIATNETYKNDKGEKITETQWHNVVAWGKQAEIAGKIMSKGSEVAIEGKLVTRNFTTNDGTKRYVTEIILNEMVLISSPKASE